jgi:hypothetical protein
VTERAGTATAVPVRLPLPIRALTWEADTTGAGWRWLLPAAAVLEVTRCDMPAPLPLPLATASALVRTLLGTVAWRGRRLPLLSLLAREDDADGAAEPAAGSATMGGIARLRAVVCPCLGADAVTPAFGLAAQGLPSLLMLREGEVEPGDADAAPPFAAAVLRVRGARYVVPDLDALSAVLAPLGGLPD